MQIYIITSSSLRFYHCSVVILHSPSFQRIVKKPRAKKQQEYDSDDPEAYGNEAIPDKVIFGYKLVCIIVIIWLWITFVFSHQKSSTYVEDKIDEFHNEKISVSYVFLIFFKHELPQYYIIFKLWLSSVETIGSRDSRRQWTRGWR